MAIQLRHGLKRDFNPEKMMTAEMAVATDTKEIFVAFAPGDCKKMATYEDMQEDIKNATGDIIDELTEDIDKAVQDAGEAIESANTASEAAGQAAEIANTASEEANQAAERAEAASKSIEDKLGKEDIIEGDNITIEKTEDGKIRINADGGGPNIQTKDGDTQDNVVTFTSYDHSDAEAEGMYTGFDPIESGESHSSIFEKISRAMNNVRAIIKMIGTTDITQIGNGTITGALTQINADLSELNSNIDSKDSDWITVTCPILAAQTTDKSIDFVYNDKLGLCRLRGTINFSQLRTFGGGNLIFDTSNIPSRFINTNGVISNCFVGMNSTSTLSNIVIISGISLRSTGAIIRGLTFNANQLSFNMPPQPYNDYMYRI